MQHTGGRVFASTAALAGTAGVAYDLSWAILWIAIVIALFDTVFQLIRAIGRARRGGTASPRSPPSDDTVISLP